MATIFCVAKILAQNNQKKTAEQEYQNIQVLKGMPAEDLLKTMDLMSASLGVNCTFCHSDSYEKDDVRNKQTARKMIKMTFELNKNYFDGKLEITCSSCHRGEEHPASYPALIQIKPPIVEPENKPKETLPTIDQLLDKYVQALGGKTSLEKITSRTMKGLRVDEKGEKIVEEVFQKAPNKMVVVTDSATIGFDGNNSWARDNDGDEIELDKDELEQFKREAELFQSANLKAVYKQMSVAGVDKINDKEAYIVRTVTNDNKRERLYFDKLTGLLVRRYSSSLTILGQYPIQIDYLDYKLVGGVKIPFTIQWSQPNHSWSLKFSVVKNNVAIADEKFKPTAKKN